MRDVRLSALRDQTGGIHLAFLGLAAVAGFGASALLAGALELPRAWFLVPYVAVVAGLLAAWARSTGIDLGAAFRAHPARGVAVGTVVAAFLVANVVGQPASARAEGAALAFQLAWFGLAYGVADALLLSVMPVLAVEGALGPGRRRIAVDVAALLASCVLAASYHLGYPEFRGAIVLAPIFGNAVITLAYLAGRSPVAPVLAHVAMHVAAVLHGPASTLQLPPHY